MKRRLLLLGLFLAVGTSACTLIQRPRSSAPSPTPFLAPQQPPTPTATRPMEASPTVPPSPSPLPTPTFTFTPPFTPTPATGSINGVVWQDICSPGMAQSGNPSRCRPYGNGWVGNGTREQGELGLAGVRVRLAQGACPGTPMSITVTNSQGSFLFEELPPGTYCVFIDPQDTVNQALLGRGVWTRPGLEQNEITVTVQPGKTVTLSFAYSSLVMAGTPTQVAAPGTPTATAVARRPAHPRELGQPDVLDTMENPRAHWNLRWDSFMHTTYRNGRFTLHLWQPRTLSWVLSKYPPLRNAYIEAVFITGPVCAHKDSYGFIVRAPTKYEGYVFVVSCDGMRKVMRWNGGLVVFKPWDWARPLRPEEQGKGVYQTYPLHTGPNQVNRIGVWMEDDTMRLYINRILVAEIQDDFFPEGMFGLVIGGESSGFRVSVEELAYWKLP